MTNGKTRGWAEVVALVAGMAAFLVPMQQKLASVEEHVGDLGARFESTVLRESDHSKDERDRMEVRLKAHSDNNAAQIRLELSSLGGSVADHRLQVDGAIADLRERMRGATERLASVSSENETQHQSIRGTIDLIQSIFDQRDRAYWDGTRIVWPDLKHHILEGIGEARVPPNGK